MPKPRKQFDFKDRDLWYLVGLIATDGNLSSDGRHVDITSKHRDFLETVKKKLGFENKIGTKCRGKGLGEYYRIQIANKNFYDFLLSIGLLPKKSLILGELKVPMKWFPDFIRGVIDGDGSIRRWNHPSNGGEQWSLRIYSASSAFIDWLEQTIAEQFEVVGKVYCSPKSTVFVLKYGKLAAKQILKCCYYEGCLGLERKARLAQMCGVSRRVWSKSKTLLGTV